MDINQGIVDFWNTSFNFFNGMSALFLATLFGLAVERIAEEMEKAGFNLPHKIPNGFLQNLTNFLFRVAIAFFIAFLFFALIFIIIAILMGMLGFIISKFH